MMQRCRDDANGLTLAGMNAPVYAGILENKLCSFTLMLGSRSYRQQQCRVWMKSDEIRVRPLSSVAPRICDVVGENESCTSGGRRVNN